VVLQKRATVFGHAEESLVWAREPVEGSEAIPNCTIDQAAKDCRPSRADEVVESTRKIYSIISELN
jgi:hypothetical protein